MSDTKAGAKQDGAVGMPRRWLASAIWLAIKVVVLILLSDSGRVAVIYQNF